MELRETRETHTILEKLANELPNAAAANGPRLVSCCIDICRGLPAPKPAALAPPPDGVGRALGEYGNLGVLECYRSIVKMFRMLVDPLHA